MAAALLRVFKMGKKRDQSTLTQDFVNRSQISDAGQETWMVVYDGPVDQYVARDAAGLPKVGTTYDGRFCTSKRAIRSAESPYAWEVIVDYLAQTIPVSGETAVWNVNIRKSSAAREETVYEDRLELPLVNAFGDLFQRLPTLGQYDDVYTLTWQTKTPPNWGPIEGRTNSDNVEFTICGIHKAFTKSQMKCVGADFSCTKTKVTETGPSPFQLVFNCEIAFQIRLPKWVWSAPNEGWNGVDPDDNPGQFTQNYQDPYSPPLTTPTYMDLDAKKLASGAKVLMFPRDAIGNDVPFAGRDFPEDGSFELEKQAPFQPLLAGLNDS